MRLKWLSKISIFFVLMMFSCIRLESPKFNCEKLESLWNLKNGHIDISKFDSTWNSLKKHDWVLIEYLLSFENDSTTEVACLNDSLLFHFGPLFIKISYLGSYYIPTNEVGALYLICALYEDNYFFASDKILYDNNEAVFDCSLGGYVKYFHPNSDPDYFLNNPSENKFFDNFLTEKKHLNQAWELTKNWYILNKGTPLKDLKEQGNRPFGNSMLYWFGEEGGKINNEFPHKLTKGYKRFYNQA